jgi:hypothetical protein
MNGTAAFTALLAGQSMLDGNGRLQESDSPNATPLRASPRKVERQRYSRVRLVSMIKGLYFR